MNNITGFNALPVETQYILISKTISNLNNHLEKDIIFNQIKIESIKTEMLFYNNSLKSPHLYNVLSAFKDVSFEIQHLSKSFDNIINLLVKIKRNKVKSIKIGCSLYDLESKELAKKQFQNTNNITYFTFDSSIHIIPDDFFAKCKFVKRILIPSSITEIKKGSFSYCTDLCEVLFEHPSSLLKIGDICFNDTKIKQISIPSSVIKIGNVSLKKYIMKKKKN